MIKSNRLMNTMNVFFYAGSAGKQEQQFAEALLQRISFAEIVIFPGGGELCSPLSLKLRSGDLLILCAASEESLNALLVLHKKFEDFRIILVLPRQDDELMRKSHLLRPRYITCLSCDAAELDSVIEKMILSHGSDRLSGSDKNNQNDGRRVSP